MKVPSIRVLGFSAALLALGLGVAFWPRAPESPEELVRRKVVAMTLAAQEKDVAAIMEHVSQRFRSVEGADKEGLRSLVAFQLLRGQWVRVFTTELSVQAVSPEEVEISGKFIFGRSDAQQLKDLAKESVMATYAIEGKAQKESDGQWRFVWARYQFVDPATLF